jgi:hypothetical protein
VSHSSARSWSARRASPHRVGPIDRASGKRCEYHRTRRTPTVAAPQSLVERLERQARNYRERKRAEEAERERLHAEIKHAARAGMSHQAISDVLAGQGVEISRATVQRIAAQSP